MNFRSLEVRAATINEADRSIEVLLTTETPVAMYDWDRYERVMEVLLTSGAQLPSSRQVPLLESHHRYTTDDQLGSVRDLKATPEGVVGRAVFSSLADNQWTKVKEGHVTDVSAGYQVLERVYVPKGSTSTVQGKTYTGPINIATKWKLREGSITPIGADEQAKLRGLDPSTLRNFHEGEGFMNEELRALCVERGMPTDATEEQAQKFLAEHFRKEAPKKPATEERKELPAEVKLFNPDEFRKAVKDAAKEFVTEERTQREAFRKEVDGMADLANYAGSRTALYEMKSPEEVRKHLMDERAKQQENVPAGIGDFRVHGGEAQITKQRGELRTALINRCFDTCGAKEDRRNAIFPVAERSAGNTYRNSGLFQMAEECLRMDGVDIRGATREQIAIAALGWPEKAGLRADAAYHTTGSFTKLTQDAVNKSMMLGYQEFPSTWQMCFRQGPSVPDFKLIHKMRMGALPNLPDWPTNKAPEQLSFKDVEETYRVQAKSAWISFSWDLLINDDMDAISRAPSMFGESAARTVNALAWAQYTSNPTMEDSKALFLETPAGARYRSNLTTGAGAPSVTTVQTLTNKMMQMRGENTPEGLESSDILNLTPRYIVGPGALRTTILQLTGSPYDPAGTNSITYNTANGLIPVIEPLLDVASTTAWGLIADKSRIDTIEVSFLQGHESPKTRSWMDEKTLSQNWAVVQCVGAKALQYRGMQKHDGA